jgi:hypothetical protein
MFTFQTTYITQCFDLLHSKSHREEMVPENCSLAGGSFDVSIADIPDLFSMVFSSHTQFME